MPKPRLVLLLILPILLLAIMKFAQTGSLELGLVSVSNDGSEVICHSLQENPERQNHLIRFKPGAMEMFKLRNSENRVRTVAGREFVACYSDGQISILNLNDSSVRSFDASFNAMKPDAKREERPSTQTGPQVDHLVISNNEKFLYFVGKDSAGKVSAKIVDLSSFETVWQAENNVELEFFVSIANCVSTLNRNRLVKRARDPSIADDRFLPTGIYEFENGVPEWIMDVDGFPVPAVSKDRRYLISKPTIDEIVVKDTVAQTERVLNFAPYTSNRFAIADDESKLIALLEFGDSIRVFDLETLKPTNAIDSAGQGMGDFAISSNGRFLGTKAVTLASSWGTYFGSGCQYSVSKVYVTDLVTGKRTNTFQDTRPYWLWFTLSIVGGLLWSLAWIRTEWKRLTTAEIIGDIALLSLLWLSVFYLRFIYGGWQLDSLRPSAVASLWFLGSMTALIGIWVVFSHLRLSFKILAAVFATLVAWAGPLYLWQHYDFPAQGMPIGCLAIAMWSTITCFWMKWSGWRLNREDEVTRADESKSEFQLPLVDLVTLPLAIGLLMVVAKMIPVPIGIPTDQVTYYVFLSITYAMVVMVGFWGAFSSAHIVTRLLLSAFLILLLSTGIQFTPWRLNLEPLWWNVAVGVGLGTWTLFSLSLLRQNGWRLRRTKRA